MKLGSSVAMSWAPLFFVRPTALTGGEGGGGGGTGEVSGVDLGYILQLGLTLIVTNRVKIGIGGRGGVTLAFSCAPPPQNWNLGISTLEFDE